MRDTNTSLPRVLRVFDLMLFISEKIRSASLVSVGINNIMTTMRKAPSGEVDVAVVGQLLIQVAGFQHGDELGQLGV